MIPMTMPMKARAPRIPPITAPVDGPGVICLFSSRKDEKTQREERKREERDSFKFHVSASGALMCFAAERKSSVAA